MAKKTAFSLIRQTSNYLSSVRTLFITSKLFACNLFNLPKDPHSVEPIKMRAVDYGIVLLYVVLYFVFTIPFFIEMVFVRTSILLSSGNFVIIVLVRTIFYFIIIANFSCYIMDAFNKNKIWQLLTKFHEFDEEATNLGVFIKNNNKVFVIYAIRLSLMQITMTAICGVMLHKQFDAYWLILKFYVSYVIMDGCYTTIFCLYNSFIYSLKQRFKIINDTLGDVLNIREENLLDTGSQAPHIEFDQLNGLNKLSNLYEKLIQTMRLLSECYSLQISLIAAVVFQFTLVCFYMIYRIFIGKYTTNTILVTYAYSMRTFYFYSQILFGMIQGSKLSTHAKYTSHILSKGLNLPLEKSVLNQLERFLQQISHSFTTVSCGLFSMDWTLFHTMFAAVVSYLVLFIQFDTLLIVANTN